MPMRAAASSATNFAILLAVICALTAARAGTPVKATGTGVDAESTRHSYIVESTTVARARHEVASVGGAVDQELAIINGVTARLGDAQVSKLRLLPDARVFEDRAVGTRGSAPSPLKYT